MCLTLMQKHYRLLLLTLFIANTQICYANANKQLLAAVEQGNVAQVQATLKQGANVDSRNSAKATALLIATRKNHIKIAELLITAGADVNAKDKIHDSPYLYAGARGHNEILLMTLNHGADLKSVNRYGGTALIPASERGHVETVRILIKAGVDVNHINKLHWTALIEAIVLGNGSERYVEIVKLLLEAKADPQIADKQGITPLQHARKLGYKDIEALLIKAGAK